MRCPATAEHIFDRTNPRDFSVPPGQVLPLSFPLPATLGILCPVTNRVMRGWWQKSCASATAVDGSSDAIWGFVSATG